MPNWEAYTKTGPHPYDAQVIKDEGYSPFEGYPGGRQVLKIDEQLSRQLAYMVIKDGQIIVEEVPEEG